MKKQSEEYLTKTIGLAGAALDRAKETCAIYEEFLGWEIEDIFVSEYLDGETRIYESLWIFAGELLGEAKAFITDQNYDIIRLKTSIEYVNFISKDFFMSGEQSNNESRLTVVFISQRMTSSTLKASRSNCIYLRNILRDRLLPNVA